MITDLWIENFKGIGKRQHIPLRPVTLLFGANSAGKSTVLHAILYLREVICRNQTNPTGPIDGGQTVNLGGFKNFLHHGKGANIRIGLRTLGWNDVYSDLPFVDRNLSTEDEDIRQTAFAKRNGTGYHFHGSVPPTEVEFVLDEFGLESIEFCANKLPAVVTWREDWYQNEPGRSQLHRDASSIVWVDPTCPYLDLEFFLDLNYGGQLAQIGEACGADHDWRTAKTQSGFNSIAQRLAQMWRNAAASEDLVGLLPAGKYLCSRNVLFLPTRPYVVTHTNGETTGLFVRTSVVLSALSDPPVPSQVDSFVEFRLTTDESAILIPIAIHLRCESPFSSSHFGAVSEEYERLVGQLSDLRQRCWDSEHAGAFRLPGVRDLLSNLDLPLRLKPMWGIRHQQDWLQLSNWQAMIDELIRGSLGALRDWLTSMLYVGPKRSSVPRNLNDEVGGEHIHWGDGLGAWRWLLSCDVSDVNAASDLLSSKTEGLGTEFEIERIESYEIDATLFHGLNEGYTPVAFVQGVLGGDPDEPSQMLLDFENAKCRRRLMLRRATNSQLVHPQDVGEGITQVVPVIAAILRLRSEDLPQTLLAVEQPELHLHPSLSAKLADVFLLPLSSDLFRHYSLIETHSEHMILRILRRIRQTTNGELPEHIPPIKPEDVCVLWVDNLGDGTTFQRLRIDDQGEFIDRWPRGFFSERAEELY